MPRSIIASMGTPRARSTAPRAALWRSRTRALMGWLPLTAALGWVVPGLAQETSPTEVRKLVPADVVAGDRVGAAVAVDGTRALIGAIKDDDSGTDAGAAYLYDVSTGQLLRKLLASGRVTETFGFADDFFGHSVALRGSLAVVGAANSSAAGASSGAAYVIDADTGVQRAKLLPFVSRPGEMPVGQQFGFSLALSQSRIVVGAPGDVSRRDGGGSLYFYDASTLALTAKVFPSDPGFADNFGRTVAASGDMAATSAMFDDDNGTDSGSVYVFDAVSGQQRFKLRAADGAPEDLFGFSLAAHGKLLAVGAPFDDDRGTDSGAVYLFDSSTGQQLAKFTPADGAAGDLFGWSVALTADRLLVGAPLDDGPALDAGTFYVFDLSTGVQLAEYRASDAEAGDAIASTLAAAGTTVVAGAQNDSDAGENSGSAYVFALDGGDGGVPTTIRVANIEAGVVSAGRRLQRAQVAITIVDDRGNPVQGATVTVALTGALSETLAGQTDTRGVTTLMSTQTVRVRRGNTLVYQVCVTSVTGPLPHDTSADAETCDSP
jgi:hypothetical protein